MIDRVLCFTGNKFSLYFANKEDIKFAYDIMHTPEMREVLFQGGHDNFTLEEYLRDEDNFFPGEKSKNAYLLIEKDGEFIGWISHTYHDGKIKNFEIDIVLKVLSLTGKGLGTKIITSLTDYLNKEYNIKTFIIRPGKHNQRAIRAYEKSGFIKNENFDASEFYAAENAELWGDGDYGVDGTYNMIKKYI